MLYDIISYLPHPRRVGARRMSTKAAGLLYLHSAKGGAVETGCSDLYYVVY